MSAELDTPMPITWRQRLKRWWWGVYLIGAENRRLKRDRKPTDSTKGQDR